MSAQNMPDNPEQPHESGLAANEMVCPRCEAVVKRNKYMTHLISQCSKSSNAGVPASPDPHMVTGLFAEYQEEKERETRVSYGHSPYHVKAIGSRQTDNAGGLGGKWTTCSRCAEGVKTNFMQQHRCPSYRIYVQELPRLGITAVDFAKAIEAILQQWPGMSAAGIAAKLTQRYRRNIDKSIANSVLYTFRNSRFHRIPEGDEFDDEWNPPSWYCGSG